MLLDLGLDFAGFLIKVQARMVLRLPPRKQRTPPRVLRVDRIVGRNLPPNRAAQLEPLSLKAGGHAAIPTEAPLVAAEPRWCGWIGGATGEVLLVEPRLISG